MTTRTPHFALAAELLAPAEAKHLLSDGTLWSHAATLGTRIKGTEFTIDTETVQSFVRNFVSGYPSKVPVDYDHGATSGIADGSRPVPKAGDVLELKAVLAAADLNASMQQQVQAAGRALDDARNFGLWARWKPTRRALSLILEREYSEMSIAFDEDFPHNTTGAGQGPTILAIALTNTPFLDDMISVAASRGVGGSPPAAGIQEPSMSKPTMLARLSAALGRAFSSDDEAADTAAERITQLQRETQELAAFRTNATALHAELGVTDHAGALAKVRELKTAAETARQSAETERTKALSAQIDGILKKHEDKIVAAEKPYLTENLKRELASGIAAGQTPTEKMLGARPKHGIAERASGADTGEGEDLSEDQKIAARAQALMTEDATIKALAARDERAALIEATVKARREMSR